MNSQDLVLACASVLGVFAHNLVNIQKLNRSSPDGINMRKYVKMEWPTLLLSFTICAACLMAKNEIIQLQIAGNYLILGFFSIGYANQSILFFIFSLINKKIDTNGRDKKETTGTD